VPKRKAPIQTERECEIGSRVREARERLRYSQAVFARSLGLTPDKLRFIESGRTPLRYGIAWQLRDSFRISLDWLSGDGTLAGKDHLHWPNPNTASAADSSYFSEVLDLVLAAEKRALKSKSPFPFPEGAAKWDLKPEVQQAIDNFLSGKVPDSPPSPGEFPQDISRRNFFRECLVRQITGLLESLTADSLLPFADSVTPAIRDIGKKFPHLPVEMANHVGEEMEAQRLREAVPAPKPPAEPPVKPPLPVRRRRAPRA
jgi:transcriptional regulator with XRE-family HTH domain